MADYKLNPPAKTNAPQQSPSGSEKGQARIWNVFGPTIVIDEISLPQSEGDGRKTQRIEDIASVKYPLIKINDYLFSKEEIDSLTIDSTEKLPKITLTVSFSNELFLSKNMPKDGDMISVMIQSLSEVLKPIRNDYVITGVVPTRKSTGGGAVSMTLFGRLFIPGWDSFMGDSAENGTTMKILKRAAKAIGLGFSTNEDDTDDSQVWIACNTPVEFISSVVECSWKDENSFFDWWIDVYYNLNFINVQKQLLSEETEVDIAAFETNTVRGWNWGNKKDSTTGMPKVFSNYVGYRSSSFYINRWRPINRSSEITFTYGTSLLTTFFEHNNILYDDPESRKYWELDTPPDYDKDKINTHILLRGRARWDPSTGSDEPAKANYNYSELYKKSPWLGIQYTVTNPEAEHSQWTGNHHRNYMRSKAHNVINMAELEKLNVDIEVNGVNLNIIRGDKMPVALVRKNRMEGKLVQSDFDTAESLDYFYSGWYYVKGLSLSWTSGYDNMTNNFTQNFILTRREWPAPVPVESAKKR